MYSFDILLKFYFKNLEVLKYNLKFKDFLLKEYKNHINRKNKLKLGKISFDFYEHKIAGVVIGKTFNINFGPSNLNIDSKTLVFKFLSKTYWKLNLPNIIAIGSVFLFFIMYLIWLFNYIIITYFPTLKDEITDINDIYNNINLNIPSNLFKDISLLVADLGVYLGIYL